MLTSNYIRGSNDARRYSNVDQTETGWIARRSETAAPVWILEPVDRGYLQGLHDGGCKVRTRGDARPYLAGRELGRKLTAFDIGT